MSDLCLVSYLCLKKGGDSFDTLTLVIKFISSEDITDSITIFIQHLLITED